jgi:hypothetical protein
MEQLPPNLSLDTDVQTEELLKQVYLAVQIEPGREGRVNIWLVNETEQALTYSVRAGEYATVDDEVMIGATQQYEQKAIGPRSTILFDTDFFWGFDFVDWWAIDLKDGDGVLHKLDATRGKYGWSDERRWEPIPFTKKRGVLLGIRAR